MMYLIQIDDEFWIKFKTCYGGRWTKNRSLATAFSLKEVAGYRRDWRKWGERPFRRIPR